MNEVTRIVLSVSLGFILTFLCMKFLPLGGKLLGHDRGRLYAPGSEVNIGKPTGVGIYFVIIFVLVSLIFGFTGAGLIYAMIFVLFSMLFGYLDDRARNPWGEYIKGGLDFIVAAAGAVFYVISFDTDVTIGITGYSFEISAPIYMLLAILLITTSINATNATDGVDGLSGTVTVLTLTAFMLTSAINGTLDIYKAVPGLAMISCLLAYLIFNFNPSKVLMGDAGSRAIGYFIAFYAMYLKLPFAYLILGLPFLLDGGLSIVKITIGRLTHKKIIILKDLTTPVHDHLKKRMGFSVKKTWATISLAALAVDVIYLVLVLIF